MDDEPNMLHGNNNETNQEKFTITLKTIQGDAEEFQVEKKMTIKQFGKQYIKEKGFSENTIMIFNFKGKKLDENKTFEQLPRISSYSFVFKIDINSSTHSGSATFFTVPPIRNVESFFIE